MTTNHIPNFELALVLTFICEVFILNLLFTHYSFVILAEMLNDDSKINKVTVYVENDTDFVEEEGDDDEDHMVVMASESVSELEN